MDRAAMQNLFLYGNQGQGQQGHGQGQGQGQGGQGQGGQGQGGQGQGGQGQGQGGGNEQQPNDQQGGLDSQAAQALGVAGYPALMQQYLLQQQQQQQQQQQAAGMDPRFAGLGGAGGYNNYGAPQGMMHNQGMGGQGMGGQGMGGQGMGGQGMGGQGMGGQGMGNGMSQNGMSQNGMSQGGGHMMDQNLLLMQRFQQQQHQQQQHQQQQQQLQQQPTGQWIGDMSGEGDPYAESGILGPWSATSAGLLGKMASNAPTETKTKKVRKKPKDRPKRPLSAYNIFFKEERARILEEIPTEKDEKEAGSGKDEKDDKEKDEKDETEEKVVKAEEEQEPPADGSKPIRKRKKLPHGKIGFESLAKVIGQRWQDLESDEVKYYKDKAEEDMKRYKIEMEVYLSKQAEAKKGLDATNADGDLDKDLDEKPAKKAKTDSSSTKEVESTAAI
jgi:hypothetical protein